MEGLTAVAETLTPLILNVQNWDGRLEDASHKSCEGGLPTGICQISYILNSYSIPLEKPYNTPYIIPYITLVIQLKV